MNVSGSADSTNAPPKPPRSKALLAWMIVSQILGILVILLAAALWVLTLFLGSGAFSFGILFPFLSPLIMFIPVIGSWVAYRKRNEKLAWILTSLPILYVCLDAVFVFILPYIYSYF